MGPSLAAQDASELFQRIEQRLALMEDVARYKARHGLPVEDPAREQVVVENAIESAAALGLDPDSIDAFYRAQIEAAKGIQRRFIAEWQSDDAAPASDIKDLATELRPRLLELGDEITNALARYLAAGGELTEREREAFTRALSVKHLEPRDERRLYDAMMKIELAER